MSVSLKENITEFWQCLEESVAEAIDKKVKVDGGINSSILDERLKNIEKVLLQCIDQSLEVLDFLQLYMFLVMVPRLI